MDTLAAAGTGMSLATASSTPDHHPDENQRLARLIESVLDLNRFDRGGQAGPPGGGHGRTLERATRARPVAITGGDLKVVTDWPILASTGSGISRRQLVSPYGQ